MHTRAVPKKFKHTVLVVRQNTLESAWCHALAKVKKASCVVQDAHIQRLLIGVPKFSVRSLYARRSRDLSFLVSIRHKVFYDPEFMVTFSEIFFGLSWFPDVTNHMCTCFFFHEV